MEWKSQGVEENEGDELTRDENEAQPPEDWWEWCAGWTRAADTTSVYVQLIVLVSFFTSAKEVMFSLCLLVC